MTRIAIGGLMHESNTFAQGRTTFDDFERGGLETGDRIFDRWGDAHHEVAGFFDAARKFGFEVVPTLMGWATPSGPLSAETFHSLTDELLNAIDRAGKVDAVLLALHGAMVADGEVDADGTILKRVRDLIGPERILVATLDLHGNVSQRMAAATDALIAYRTYPHVDQRSRGLHAGRLAHRAAAGEIHPIQAIARPPLLIHLLAQETDREPMKGLMRKIQLLDRHPRVLDASLLSGFPYADVAACGPTCVVVTDDDAEFAEALARELGDQLWDSRRELTAGPLAPEDAVREALAETRRPVVLVDLGDNIGGGSAADSTVLAHELIRAGAEGFIVVLHDPEAVRVCNRAGVGASVEVEAGGKTDRNAPPLRIVGRVRSIQDGGYIERSPRHGGIRLNDQGLTAVVEIPGGSFVVLNSLRHPPFSLGQLTSLGLDPSAANFLVVKGAVAYKAAYSPIAGRIVEADTPGLTAANPARFAYERIRRPIFPLDPELLERVNWS
jgi:microcystin degradation protein MlrC